MEHEYATMRIKCIFLALTFSFFSYSETFAEEQTDIRQHLLEIDISERSNLEYLNIIKRTYSINSENIQTQLKKIIETPMSTSEQNGACVLLLANGTDGFLWALSQLSNPKEEVRYNILMSSRFYQFREFILICINLLDDTRTIPIEKSKKTEPSPIGYSDWRICDKALSILQFILESNKISISKDFKPLRSDTYEIRNQKISTFNNWWEAEGKFNKEIDKIFPSVITVILSKMKDQKKDI